VEIFATFFGGEVACDAAAGQRRQQIDVHGIDLDKSVASGGQKALASGNQPTLLAQRLCPARVISSRPLSMSQILTVLSSPVEPTRVPSPLTETALTKES